MSEVSPVDTRPTSTDILTGEELVTLNNYIGNHEAKLAVAGIFAINSGFVMSKLRATKELLIRQVPTNGNPTAKDHKMRIETAGGWPLQAVGVGNWCAWSLEPAGLLRKDIYQGLKGPQTAWQATEFASRALPYIGGLGEWSLTYAGVSLQQVTGDTKSTSISNVRAPQVRHSIFRKLVHDSPENPSTYEDLELATAANGIESNGARNAALELTYQGLLTKNPPNFDGRTTVKIANEYQRPISDLVQTLEDITTPDGAEFYAARALEILEDPKLFLPLIAKAKRFSAVRAGQIETHPALQQRITEALGTLGQAKVSSIYKHLQTTGRTVNRHTIHKTMRELIEDGSIEALNIHPLGDVSKTATTYILRPQSS